MNQIKHNHGYINYRDDEKDKEAIELYQTWVDEDYRQKGIATEMIKKVIEIAQKNGKNKITVYSSTNSQDVFWKFLHANDFEEKHTDSKWVLGI